MNYWRNFSIKKIPLLIVSLAGFSPLLAQAACTFSSGGSGDSEVINFGNIAVQRDAPIGSVVASTASSSAFSGRGDFIKCTTAGVPFTARWAALGTTPINYNGEQLFNVGIAGLAMRVVTSPIYGSGAFPRDRPNYRGCTASVPYTWSAFCGTSWGGISLQLVKIANVTGSGALAMPGTINASIMNFEQVYTYRVGTASSVSTVACSITNTSINVPMGSVSKRVFSGVGSTSNEQSFNIPLNCDASTKVNVTLDGIRDVSGVAGVLALDSSSSSVASGVGVQLLHNNAPATLGTPIAVGTVASSGAYSVPLTARYYQTAATIIEGQANSTATFTMTYN